MDLLVMILGDMHQTNLMATSTMLVHYLGNYTTIY